jgi:Holliday junction resolvasome RuvABC endonuclease subunit
MRIAAFDLGTTWAMAWNTGFSAAACHGVVEGARPQKLAEFHQQLTFSLPHDLDVVIFERPFARGQAATRLLWGMAAILEAAAHDAGTAVLDVTPAEIKKWSAGKGSAKKPDMIAAAQMMGYDGDNEHEADAYCLLRFAEATLTSTKGTTK